MIDFSADSIYTTGTCIEWCGQMPILCLSLIPSHVFGIQVYAFYVGLAMKYLNFIFH